MNRQQKTSKVLRISAVVVVFVTALFFANFVQAQQTGSIALDIQARNISRGNSNFSEQVAADPSDQVEFRVYLTVNNTVSNILLSNNLPSRLDYVSNSLRIDGAAAGNNLSSINLGTRSNAQIQVSWRANVTEESEFNSGTTTLVNRVNLSSSVGSAEDLATVQVSVFRNASNSGSNRADQNISLNSGSNNSGTGTVAGTNASNNQQTAFKSPPTGPDSITLSLLLAMLVAGAVAYKKQHPKLGARIINHFK